MQGVCSYIKVSVSSRQASSIAPSVLYCYAVPLKMAWVPLKMACFHCLLASWANFLVINGPRLEVFEVLAGAVYVLSVVPYASALCVRRTKAEGLRQSFPSSFSMGK